MNAAKDGGKSTGLAFTCVAITVIILLAGLWPFRFRPKNGATWLHGKDGIRFGGLSVVFTTRSVYGPRGVVHPGDPISIELLVRPSGTSKSPFSRILTLFASGDRQFFALAQDRTDLILRVAAPGKDLHRNFREIRASRIFEKGISRLITVTSRKGRTKIYADGTLATETDGFPLLPVNSEASGNLVLGVSPTGNSFWRGDLLFLAIYDRELSPQEVANRFRTSRPRGAPIASPAKGAAVLYRFNEGRGTVARDDGGSHFDLSVPAAYRVLEKSVLRPPWDEKALNRLLARDIATNILGFAPFGFFFVAWLKRNGGLPNGFDVVCAAASGASLSLLIELLQVYLPTRTSSLTDLACNLFGTIIGAMLFRWALLVLGVEKRG